MSTQELTKSDVQLHTGLAPKECAHYAKRGEVTAAYIEGTPIEALCGYVFVPTKDPNSKPVCPPCKAIYDDDLAIRMADKGFE